MTDDIDLSVLPEWAGLNPHNMVEVMLQEALAVALGALAFYERTSSWTRSRSLGQGKQLLEKIARDDRRFVPPGQLLRCYGGRRAADAIREIKEMGDEPAIPE